MDMQAPTSVDLAEPAAEPQQPQAGAAVPGTPRRIAILTPVLDDWACFGELVREISAFYTGSGVEFVICAVDDGSVTAFDPTNLSLPPESCVVQIEMLRLALNLGHQRAVAVGLCALAHRDDVDGVIVMDSDGEDRPSDIAALLAAGRQNHGQVVLARRAKRSESATFRAGYRIYKVLFYLLTGESITFGNYSLLPMAAVRRLVHMPELWNNLAGSILRSRLRRTDVATARGRRYDGSSKMKLIGLVVHGLSALSVHTDRIFVRVLLGAGLVGVASVLGLVIVAAIRLLTDLAIPGWATTAAGDLLIILLQTIVIVVAASLTMLASRSARPIIPIVDAQQFIAARECHATRPVGADAAQAGEHGPGH
jgi:hypothetical protein